MIRKISLILLVVMLLAALSGCASQPTFTQATPPPQQSPNYGGTPPTDAPTDAPEYEGNPLAEEEGDAYEAPAMADYGYAGSTPMPLDPIDMPTPTPRPKLTFTYQTYEATKLGMKFDAPAGWTVDDSASDTYILTEPAYQQKDNYSAFIILRKASVSKQYNASEMAQEVKGMLDTIGSTNFSEFKTSYTDDRTLMDHDGVYANYEGTLVDGTRVRGRVHVTCIDKVLYSIHMAHPANYNTDYLTNHGKLRETMTLTK